MWFFLSQTWEHQKVAAKAAVRMYTSGKDLTKRSVMESSSFKHANDLVDELIQLANKEVSTTGLLQNSNRLKKLSSETELEKVTNAVH